MKKHCLISDQALFLIIDLQEKLMKAMDHAEKVYKNTRIMLGVCQQLKIPVMVTEQYPKGLGRTAQDITEHLGEHLLLEKVSFSAVTQEMFEQLKGLQRRQLLVAGSETHVCVFQTVRDLVAAGYEVY
ncbi:MAG: isochorismatase family protein, partial [Syntrophaceticus sp.]|nr:isochorismatase family protein [Syntrophaceticus sp.]